MDPNDRNKLLNALGGGKESETALKHAEGGVLLQPLKEKDYPSVRIGLSQCKVMIDQALDSHKDISL